MFGDTAHSCEWFRHGAPERYVELQQFVAQGPRQHEMFGDAHPRRFAVANHYRAVVFPAYKLNSRWRYVFVGLEQKPPSRGRMANIQIVCRPLCCHSSLQPLRTAQTDQARQFQPRSFPF